MTGWAWTDLAILGLLLLALTVGFIAGHLEGRRVHTHRFTIVRCPVHGDLITSDQEQP